MRLAATTVAWLKLKKGGRKQGNIKYSGAKFSIVERWFKLNANCFV
jgi:hypothetical protein